MIIDGGRPAREEWHRWFAWHPVQCEHHLVWLVDVERRWNNYLYLQGFPSGYPSEVGGWEYRAAPQHPVPIENSLFGGARGVWS